MIGARDMWKGGGAAGVRISGRAPWVGTGSGGGGASGRTVAATMGCGVGSCGLSGLTCQARSSAGSGSRSGLAVCKQMMAQEACSHSPLWAEPTAIFAMGEPFVAHCLQAPQNWLPEDGMALHAKKQSRT